MKKLSAVVIGSGILGGPIALELARRGHDVTVIEKNSEAGSGSTAGSCAIIRFYYSTLQSVSMAYEGLGYWLDWKRYLGTEDESGLAKYIQCGSVMLKTKGHDHRRVIELFTAANVKHEDWNLHELASRFPVCRHESYWPPSRPDHDPGFWTREPSGAVEGAIYSAESGYVDNAKLAAQNVVDAARRAGARLLLGRRVVGVRRDQQCVLGVTLDDGQQIDADVVVNVAGPHSFEINRMADVEKTMNIKTRALRHEVHHVPAPDGVDFEKAGYQTSDADNSTYFRPHTGNTILVGSEDPECDAREWITNPDNFDRRITDAQWEAQVSRLARRIKGIDMSSCKEGFAELYDVSDDWIPIYDKSDLNGFYMAVGTSGNQFKNGPVVGYAMTELIERCERGQDHDRDPVVVTGKYTGAKLDMSHYSRRRHINPDSSFSVRG